VSLPVCHQQQRQAGFLPETGLPGWAGLPAGSSTRWRHLSFITWRLDDVTSSPSLFWTRLWPENFERVLPWRHWLLLVWKRGIAGWRENPTGNLKFLNCIDPYRPRTFIATFYFIDSTGRILSSNRCILGPIWKFSLSYFSFTFKQAFKLSLSRRISPVEKFTSHQFVSRHLNNYRNSTCILYSWPINSRSAWLAEW